MARGACQQQYSNWPFPASPGPVCGEQGAEVQGTAGTPGLRDAGRWLRQGARHCPRLQAGVAVRCRWGRRASAAPRACSGPRGDRVRGRSPAGIQRGSQCWGLCHDELDGAAAAGRPGLPHLWRPADSAGSPGRCRSSYLGRPLRRSRSWWLWCMRSLWHLRRRRGCCTTAHCRRHRCHCPSPFPHWRRRGWPWDAGSSGKCS
mmetsp:Transcript_68303/g.192595  ORF Transcript_68303/g.192595 Transcript_68303/m.192595 type:complete len:203 (+) Transcript_68303:922-1530(+)